MAVSRAALAVVAAMVTSTAIAAVAATVPVEAAAVRAVVVAAVVAAVAVAIKATVAIAAATVHVDFVGTPLGRTVAGSGVCALRLNNWGRPFIGSILHCDNAAWTPVRRVLGAPSVANRPKII